jgi:hypothetical protein
MESITTEIASKRTFFALDDNVLFLDVRERL